MLQYKVIPIRIGDDYPGGWRIYCCRHSLQEDLRENAYPGVFRGINQTKELMNAYYCLI